VMDKAGGRIQELESTNADLNIQLGDFRSEYPIFKFKMFLIIVLLLVGVLLVYQYIKRRTVQPLESPSEKLMKLLIDQIGVTIKENSTDILATTSTIRDAVKQVQNNDAIAAFILQRGDIVGVFGDIPDALNILDTKVAEIIDKLAFDSTEVPYSKLHYDRLNNQVESLCLLAIAVEKSFKGLSEQLLEGVNLLTEFREENQSLVQDKTKLGGQITVLQDMILSLKEKPDGQASPDPMHVAVLEHLREKLDSYGYFMGAGEALTEEVIALFLKDLTDNHEHLDYGHALKQLQKFLTAPALDDLPLYQALKLTELQQTIAINSCVQLFTVDEYEQVEKLKARWLSYLWLIYRAKLMLDTFYPLSQYELKAKLAGCIKAIDIILKSRGILPHLLDQQELFKTKLVSKKIVFYSEKEREGEVVNIPEWSEAALLKLPEFISKIELVQGEDAVYCDVAFWGYDLVNENNQSQLGIKSFIGAIDSL
jgi:hypothetical protein